uniref:Vestigial-like family member 4b n=1 Tax=Salmo trutta TaxID=8032 RepID=A0A674EG06_SALTR
MLVTKMDLLNYQYLDKMNNNIGILCYEGKHITFCYFVDLETRGWNKTEDNFYCPMENDLLFPTLYRGKPSNGNYRSSKDPRDRSRSPIERAAAPSMGLHGNHHLYAPHHHMPSLAMDQPLALTKNNMDAARTLAISPTVSPVERQQNRPSVITCAPANNRNCNLSHNGCSNNLPNNYSRRPATNTVCVDPVIEEHFRRSLGRNYKQPEPVTNSVSITGSVDDHFTKALGETWLQIKAKGTRPREVADF